VDDALFVQMLETTQNLLKRRVLNQRRGKENGEREKQTSLMIVEMASSETGRQLSTI